MTALLTQREDSEFSHVGHLPIADVLADVGEFEAVAVIRDPEDRLPSQLTYYLLMHEHHLETPITLDQAMQDCLAQKHWLFYPQAHFLEGGDDPRVDLHMYAFENIGAAQKHLGGHPAKGPYHRNRSDHLRPFNDNELRRHPLYGDVMQLFNSDYEFRARVGE